MNFDSRTDAEIWMIRNQKGRRNVSTFVMVELGLKLEELLKPKGLENERLKSFANQVEREKDGLQNSANHMAINNPVDTRKEIANFANTSHDTVMKVKKIKEKAPEEVIQKVKSGEISINQAYTITKRQEILLESYQNLHHDFLAPGASIAF